METTRPFRSVDHDACRDAILDACRDRAQADGLESRGIVLPIAPKEIETTPDSDAAKAVLIRAISAFATKRGLTHEEVRKRYRGMRQKTWERFNREGEEHSFSLMRTFQIADAIGVKITAREVRDGHVELRIVK